MIKREQELFEQLARALTNQEALDAADRINLIFSALFELDKIQRGQLDHLSTCQLQEVSPKIALDALLKAIIETENTSNKEVKFMRHILSQVMRNPNSFGLSPRMRTVALLPLYQTSIAPQGKGSEQEMNDVIPLKRNWMAKTVLSLPDISTDTHNA